MLILKALHVDAAAVVAVVAVLAVVAFVAARVGLQARACPMPLASRSPSLLTRAKLMDGLPSCPLLTRSRQLRLDNQKYYHDN